MSVQKTEPLIKCLDQVLRTPLASSARNTSTRLTSLLRTASFESVPLWRSTRSWLCWFSLAEPTLTTTVRPRFLRRLKSRPELLPSLAHEKASAPPAADRSTDCLPEPVRDGLLPSLDSGWQQGRSRDQKGAWSRRKRRIRGLLQEIRGRHAEHRRVLNVDHVGRSTQGSSVGITTDGCNRSRSSRR